MKNRNAIGIVAILLFAISQSYAGPIEDLQPGQWYEVPNSHLQSVAPNPLPPGNTGIASVTDAWCGGAFDTKRDRLILWGGGHQDYSGNEVYVFDLNTLKWARLNDPSANVGGDECSGVYPDGLPRARHTYNSVQYVPALDRYCAMGAGGFYSNGQCGNARFDAFDFAALTWEKMPNMPGGSYGTGQFTALDPVTGNVWTHGANGGSILAEFVASTKTWITHGTQYTENWFTYYLSADIDPVARKMVAVGGGEVCSWDITKQGEIVGTKITTTGATEIVAKNSPGLVYDPISKKLVAWSGGGLVYTLDVGAKLWTKIMPALSNTITPTAANSNGTFGRFRYVPSKNVFVAVNRVNENVYIYKLTAGNGSGTVKHRPNPTANAAKRNNVGPSFLYDVRGKIVGIVNSNSSILMNKRFANGVYLEKADNGSVVRLIKGRM